MKKFLKKYRMQTIFFLIVFGILVVFLMMLYPLYGSKSGSNYGNRLEGINEVKISDKVFSEIKSDASKNINCDKIDINLKGKILNIVLFLKSDTNLDKAYTYIPNLFNKLDADQLKFYDIQVFVNKNDINTIGYKSKSSDTIVWTNNK